MKKIIILAGLSGIGKTYTRTHEEGLRDLPYVDMADLYTAYPDKDWAAIMEQFFHDLEAELEEHDTVVVEGYFLPGSASWNWLIGFAKHKQLNVDYRRLMATYETCVNRVKQRGGDNMDKCLALLQMYQSRRPGLFL